MQILCPDGIDQFNNSLVSVSIFCLFSCLPFFIQNFEVYSYAHSQVRDELEHLLDDDEDMAEMYLTEKQLLENSSTSSMNERDDMDEDVLRPDIDDRH